jgi:hypothetical protein
LNAAVLRIKGREGGLGRRRGAARNTITTVSIEADDVERILVRHSLHVAATVGSDLLDMAMLVIGPSRHDALEDARQAPPATLR